MKKNEWVLLISDNNLSHSRKECYLLMSLEFCLRRLIDPFQTIKKKFPRNILKWQNISTWRDFPNLSGHISWYTVLMVNSIGVESLFIGFLVKIPYKLNALTKKDFLIGQSQVESCFGRSVFEGLEIHPQKSTEKSIIRYPVQAGIST